MFASIGTLAIAGQTAISTEYVATEIIIRHHNLCIWLKQANKQTTKQRNKHELWFLLQPHLIQTNKVLSRLAPGHRPRLMNSPKNRRVQLGISGLSTAADEQPEESPSPTWDFRVLTATVAMRV
jgi:hypothetical protein